MKKLITVAQVLVFIVVVVSTLAWGDPVLFPAANIIGQVSVAKGGTGSDNAAGARTNLGLDNISNYPAALARLASPTFTGTVTIPSPFTLGAVSITVSGAELNYLVGVTSAIQTQLNLKAPLTSPTFTGTVTIPTITVTGTGGGTIDNVSIGQTTPKPGAFSTLAVGAVTNTEFGYVAGVTSAIQTQLNLKAPIIDPTFTNNVTIDNELTVKQINTTCSAADNECFLNVSNVGDMTSNLAAGNMWVDNTTNILKLRNSDNNANLQIFTSESTNTGNFYTTGKIKGGVYTATYTNNTTLNASECYNGFIYADNVIITLPAVAAGMNVTILATTAKIIQVAPNGSDRIVLRGVAKADGAKISSTGNIANYIQLIYDSAAGWTTWNYDGTWTSP